MDAAADAADVSNTWCLEEWTAGSTVTGCRRRGKIVLTKRGGT